MKTVLLLGGPAAGQRAEVHGTLAAWISGDTVYKIVPMCSHGEVHWFGVLDGADPLALLIAGYGTAGDKLAASRDATETDIIEQWDQQRPKYGDRPLTTGIVAFMLDFMGVKKPPGDPTAFMFGVHK